MKKLSKKEINAIIEAGEQFHKVILGNTGLQINSLESLIHLDSKFFTQKPENVDFSNEDNRKIAFSAGLYLGNTIIENLGGYWCEEDRDILISIPEHKINFWPITRIYKRIQNGPEDSIVAPYMVFKAIVEDKKNN